MLVFYRPNSEHERSVDEYLHDLVRMHDIHEQNIRLIDVNSRNGSTDASLYDILSFPGVVITDDYGRYVKGWSGKMPLMDELMSYVFTLSQ